MKNSFILYTQYKEQLDLLTDEQAGVLFKTIMCYASGEELPEMDGATSMAFAFIKAQMDKDAEKYEETCEKRRNAGKQGGRPKKANGFSEKQKKQMVFEKSKKSKSPPDNDNEYDNEYEYDNDYDNGFIDDKPKESNLKVTKEKFKPPTVEEVRKYCAERGNAVDAEHFVDFYESKGWMVGKNKMKDWKSAVRNWERSEKATKPSYMSAIENRVKVVDDW